MNLNGKNFTKEQIRKLVGNFSQVAGIKSYTFNQGREKGCDAFEILTGSGLNFTILADKAMDIYFMHFKGKAISYITKSGVSSSKYSSPQGYEWLRSFGGGALTTCGLSQVGPPEKDGIWELGLHGRISNCPAYDICSHSEWLGNEYVMTLQGSMRESVLYEENLVLKRKITCLAGQNVIRISDIVENQGTIISPLMLLYHMNFGFPLLSEDTKLHMKVNKTVACNEYSEQFINEYDTFKTPDILGGTQLFYHELDPDADGFVTVQLYNEQIGYGIYIKYNKNQLPYFSQWKNTSEQDYVVGLEPGNCLPIGRLLNKEKNTLQYLKPNQCIQIDLEIGIIQSLLIAM